MKIFLSGDTPRHAIQNQLIRLGHKVMLSRGVQDKGKNDGFSREAVSSADAAIIYLSSKEKFGIGDDIAVYSAKIPALTIILEHHYVRGIPKSTESLNKVTPVKDLKEVHAAINIFLYQIKIQKESENTPFVERF